MQSFASRTSVAPPDLDVRQLRHHTKNALQRILSQIAKSRELRATPDGRRLLDDLERRVCLSSAVSDALFGLTGTPGPLADRLQRLCDALIELLGDADQLLRATVTVDPAVGAALHETVLRIVHEFVGNAIKHGLYARSVGNITVRVGRGAGGRVQLQVVDDGWGVRCAPASGEGLGVAEALAAQCGGRISLASRDGLTTAEATLHPV